jgi:hypothetical protein
MGSITNAIKALDQSSEGAAKEVKSSLEMLTTLADAKQKEIASFIDDRIKRAKENNEVPAGLKMFEVSESHVVSSKGVSEGISNALNSFLSDAEPRWKEGVKNLIGTAVNALLGAAKGASSNKSFYLIALDGHAANETQEESYVPVRIDYCLWVYNFKREGITDTVESALVYQARKSLLDFENIPSHLQIDMALKNIGTPKALRDELIEYLKNEKQTKNLKTYFLGLEKNVQENIKSIFPDLAV